MHLTCLNHPFVADPAVDWLLQQASRRQKDSRAPATWKAHKSAVANYLAFAHRTKFNPRRPPHTMLCAYIEYVALHVNSPATISNNMAHIRQYINLVGGSRKAAFHPRVTRALEGVKRSKKYQPRVKNPVDLKILLEFTSFLLLIKCRL